MLRSAAAGLGLAVIASTAAAELDLITARWLKDLQRSEEMVAAAIDADDGDELRTQSNALYHLMGRSDDLRMLPELGKMACIMAAQSLAAVAKDLTSRGPARAFVEARADARIFRRYMANCEQAVGTAVPRKLPF